MIDPTILFVKPQSLSKSDRITLKKIGVTVIELENPHEAKFIRAGFEISSSDMLGLACQTILEAAKTTNTTPADFGKRIANALSNHAQAGK